MAVPGGVFSYGEAGEGFTPDVALDIRAGGATPTDPNVALWALSFGDLENVVFADPASGFMEVTLTANAGFEVALHGFDLAGYPFADWVINGITISSPTATLFSQSSVLVEGGAGTVRHTEFSFASPLVASQLGRWNGIALTGEDYKAFGEVTAWRVTLWDGETMLAEQKSFLW